MSPIRTLLRSARPLPSTHWSFPAVLVLAAVACLFSLPCSRGAQYLAAIVPTAVVCLVLWANHLAKAPLRSAGAVAAVLGRSTYDLFALLVLFVIACIPVAVVLPVNQCYSDRARASEILLAGSPLRSDIEARILKSGSVQGSGHGFAFTPSGRARAGFVTDDGVIVVAGEDPPVVFLLSPKLAAGAVSWTCRAFPEKVVPMPCRGKDGA